MEIEDTAVLQEVSYNGTYMDILAHTRDSHSQTADASDQQVNLHATGRCMIKSCNDLRITKRVHLRYDHSRHSLLRVLCLSLDQLQETILHPDWCHD